MQEPSTPCKKKVGGTIRIFGATTKCLATETKMSWPDRAEMTALNKRVASIEALPQHFSRNGDDISINGANLWITSGSGAADGHSFCFCCMPGRRDAKQVTRRLWML